jgi:biofilm PGA synthesis protein PgaA
MKLRSGLTATTVSGVLAAAAVALLRPALAQPNAPTSPGAESARATALARSGRYDEALALLAALRAAAPSDAALLHDQTIVLAWAERDDAVLANASALDASHAPVYVLTAVGKSARNLRRFDEAVRWYALALERQPGAVDAALGLALTQADRRDGPAARRALAQVPAASAATTPVQLATAYVAQATGQPLEALRLYECVLASSPHDRAAARGKALALRALLLPTEALAFAAAHEGILSDAEIARLKADEAALQVRLVTSTPYPPPQRAAHYSRTLAALDEQLATITDPAARTAVRSDRVIALAQANRSAEAIAEFERLRGETVSPPFEALVAAGRAHLDAGNPERAVELLLAASALRTTDVEVRFDLVFAYLAAERPNDALRVAHDLTRELPRINSGPGALVTKGNPAALRAELVAAVAEAYTDQLQSAQQRLEALLAAAPNNADARQELANVYRWRGWLDRSQAEYRQVLAVQPDGIAARAGYAHARLDAAAFAEVEHTVGELQATDAADPAVRRLVDRWSVERRSELQLDISDSRSSGTTFGSEQADAAATWWSQPLGQWRAVAHVEHASADFPEGEASLRRAGAGAEYRSEQWLTSALALRDADGDDAGLRLRGDRRLGDRWRLAASLDLDSSDAPLRGRRVGLETDVLSALAELRVHEGGNFLFGWRRREHSDGNEGDSYFAQGWFRLHNAPRSKLDLTGDVASASNLTDQVVYFSPPRDLFALVGLRHTARLYRRDERSLTQVLDVGGGSYDQEGFANGRIWRLGYRLRVAWSDMLYAEIGAERTRLFYDGAPEYGTSLAFELTARL